MAAHVHGPEHHVQDTREWQFFDRLFGDKIEWTLPKFNIGSYEFHITKFMIVELVAAALMLVIFIPIARRARNGVLPKGRWWNAFESLLTFVRNEIARPTIGGRDADRYVPFLWTLFIFILFNNLLGLIPFLGSPTASIWATGALALCSFVMLHGAAIVKLGLEEERNHQTGVHGEATEFAYEHGHGHDPIHPGPYRRFALSLKKIPGIGPILAGILLYLQSMWPHIDVPYVGWLFSLMIFVIEMLGTIIKSGVLAVRLFANMFAGHMVLASILLFILTVKDPRLLWGVVTVGSVFGATALSLLELFVAFLQAYIFTFLTALFMGMSLNPEH
jgi:F-type H+-transporting ATPase subunit a